MAERIRIDATARLTSGEVVEVNIGGGGSTTGRAGVEIPAPAPAPPELSSCIL